MISEILCLATAVFFEGRSESEEAQKRIAETVVVRAEDARYPDGLCEVVFQKNQYSFTSDGRSNDLFDHLNNPAEEKAALIALEIAEEVLNKTTLRSSTHYLRHDVEAPWESVYNFDGRVGAHEFYTNNTPWR